MKDLTKMMIFMFLGLIFTIAVLGFHRSPAAPKSLLGNPTSTPKTPTYDFNYYNKNPYEE